MKIIQFLLMSFFLSLIIIMDIRVQEISLTDSRGNPVPRPLLQRISVNMDSIPLIDALSILSQKGKFHLNYNIDIIPADKYVYLTCRDVPAVTILYQLLQDTDIGFVVTKGGQIVLVHSEYLEKEKKYTISGFISDTETGEVLVGTNIVIRELRVGCTSNKYGFYSMTVPTGDYLINYSYIGYESKEIAVVLNNNIKLNVGLKSVAISGDTVIVSAYSEDNILKTTEIGTFNLIPRDHTHIAVFLGEQDIFRTIQLLPGVGQMREADCGFYVRGGNSDQNLILLDEAPVYNAVHLLGTFSVFNPDVIKNIKLIKGSAPPKYGGKLSSVLDIQMKEGSLKKFGGKAVIGTIFSRATLEGPIVKDKASFIVSGRRTYADIFTKLSSEETVRNSQLYFYDFNLKTNYRFSEKDRIYLSGYVGKDFMNVSEDEDIVMVLWENRTGTLRWNHLFTERLFSNSSVVYSRFRYGLGNIHEEESVDISSMVNDLTFKMDFQYFKDPYNAFNFGLQLVHHTYQPSQWLIDGSQFFDIRIGRRKAKEVGIYVSHEYDASDKFKLDYGLRYWLFSVSGEEDLFDLLQIDEIPHAFFHLILHDIEQRLYTGLEPRFLVNYLMNSSSSIKFGYTRNYQNVHMLSNSTSGTPLNVWHPSSSTILPQRADQLSLGYFYNLESKMLEISGELFYKEMSNQMDYRDGADILLSSLFESELVSGRGWAYGIELFFKKRTGRLSGWIGYTWSKSKRKFDEINDGNPFPARNDRTHDFATVGIFRLSNRLTFSANWTFQTGRPVTIPYGKYVIDGRVIDAYTMRNAYRMPVYHRLDLGFTVRIGKRSELNVTIYNAYGRKNAYAILFNENERNPQIIEPVKLSLFSFLPSISYHIIF